MDAFDSVADFQYGQAHVDGIAIKDTGKTGSNDDGDARCLDSNRRVFSRDDPQPKLRPPTMISPSCTLGAKDSSISTIQ